MVVIIHGFTCIMKISYYIFARDILNHTFVKNITRYFGTMAYIFCQKATHAQVPMYQVKIDSTLCTEITGAIVAYKDDMNVDKQSTV